MSEETKATSTCRHFYEHKGEIRQDPEEAVFYRGSKRRGGFSIVLCIKIYLEHGLKGGDGGVDRFCVTLVAEDLERKDIPRRHRTKHINVRWFEDAEGLLAWLRSPYLEDSVRAGIVHHPPAPIPSPERNLARALIGFADEVELHSASLKKEQESRASMCPCYKKTRSNL